MREIELTQGKIALVNDEDYDKLSQFKWRAGFDGWNWYAQRTSPGSDSKRKTIWMHREILNAQNGLDVDHRNGNGLDNQKENLRLCTNQQNQHNRQHPHKNNKLKIKGVHWIERLKKFKAQIKINGKVIYLGSFNVLGDADSAYRIAEEKHFGDFARKGNKIEP